MAPKLWSEKLPRALGGPSVSRVIRGGEGLPKSIADALAKARRIGSRDLLLWADSSLASIGRNILDAQREPLVVDYLRTAHADAAQLYAVLTAALEQAEATEWVKSPDVRPSPTYGVTSVRQG